MLANMTVKELITKHEGIRLKPYLDTVGKLTIGIGRNLTDVGITTIEAEMLLDTDLRNATAAAQDIFPMFWGYSDGRKKALVDMLFNLGKARFLGFQKFIAAVKAEDWITAEVEMLDSLWATQVPSRAQEDAALILAG